MKEKLEKEVVNEHEEEIRSDVEEFILPSGGHGMLHLKGYSCHHVKKIEREKERDVEGFPVGFRDICPYCAKEWATQHKPVLLE